MSLDFALLISFVVLGLLAYGVWKVIKKIDNMNIDPPEWG